MKRIILVLVATVALVFISGCASSRITVDEAYRSLKPVKQLELPQQVENNLVIIIENVADEGSSYKNHIDLFINDKKIMPNWLVSNVENTYTFKIKLKPGYYKVRADYYAYVGWGEDKYPIETDDLVRVTYDARTIVKHRIAKQPNGEPVDKKMYFKVQSEPFSRSELTNLPPGRTVDIGEPVEQKRPNPIPNPPANRNPVPR